VAAPTAVAGADRVYVLGLRDFLRELKAVGVELPKEVRKTNLEVAQFVVGEAISTAVALGGVHEKASPAMKAAGQQRYALAKIDSRKYPFALGAEFGGGGRSTTRQFPPHRGSGSDAGYALYPTIRAKTDEIVERYGEALDRISVMKGTVT
jgi:hypothetical protein